MKRVGDLVPTVPKFESCGVCSKDGFVSVRMKGTGAADAPAIESWMQVRCRCWTIHMQKVGEALRTRNEKKK